MALTTADIHQLVIDLGGAAGDRDAVLEVLRDIGRRAEDTDEAAAACTWALAFTFANCVTPTPKEESQHV